MEPDDLPQSPPFSVSLCTSLNRGELSCVSLDQTGRTQKRGARLLNYATKNTETFLHFCQG